MVINFSRLKKRIPDVAPEIAVKLNVSSAFQTRVELTYNRMKEVFTPELDKEIAGLMSTGDFNTAMNKIMAFQSTRIPVCTGPVPELYHLNETHGASMLGHGNKSDFFDTRWASGGGVDFLYNRLNPQATDEEIADIQQQLAACANDPNLTIVTTCSFDYDTYTSNSNKTIGSFTISPETANSFNISTPEQSQNKNILSPEEKESIIAQALESDEGRAALAASMVEPIRTSLEYASVGRKMLMVDELPQGALARYERNVASMQPVRK